MKKADIPHHIVSTALNLAVERGWSHLSLAEISVEAKVPLSQLHQIFTSKAAILRFISDQADHEIFDDEDEDRLQQPAKDRLFDLLMNRFDALTPFKEGLQVIVKESRRDPLSGLMTLCNLKKSMALTLEAAGLSTTGLRGMLRVKALLAVYVGVFQAWLYDESEDLTKTMATLDKALERLDTWAKRCSKTPRAHKDKEDS